MSVVLTNRSDRQRILAVVVASVLLGIALYGVAIVRAFAHDSWISQGAHRNAAGEWCCGEGDCFVVSAQHVTLPAPGYRIADGEFIPEAEAQPSQDGQYWRCKRPDGSRRCFFFPPPSW